MSDHANALGTERVPALFQKLVLPAVAAQVVNLAYNLVDRVYIGHIPKIGGLALTGVGVCMPVITRLLFPGTAGCRVCRRHPGKLRCGTPLGQYPPDSPGAHGV